MNKSELISAVANEAGVSKAVAEKVINATIGSIGDALASKKDGKVTLIGFGTFSRVKREARKGRNPQTGKEIKIAARDVPKFTPGAELKKKVNGGK